MFFSLTMSPYQMKIHLFGADVVFLQKFYGVQQSLHLTNQIIKTKELLLTSEHQVQCQHNG